MEEGFVAAAALEVEETEIEATMKRVKPRILILAEGAKEKIEIEVDIAKQAAELVEEM